MKTLVCSSGLGEHGDGEGRAMRMSFPGGALVLALTVFPVDAQPRPTLQLCDDDAFCLQAYDMIDREYPQARRGNYQAMRNVAFCMWTGCDGAVKINRKGSCEWRRQIMRRHPKTWDDGDAANLSMCRSGGF